MRVDPSYNCVRTFSIGLNANMKLSNQKYSNNKALKMFAHTAID